MLTRKLSPLGRLNPSNAITTQSTIINSSKIQELTNQIDQLSDALKDRA